MRLCKPRPAVVVVGMFAAAWALALPSAVPSVPVTIDFESLPVGTAITSQIACLGGSTGGITLAAATPPGIHGTLAPNPVNGTATSLTITADASAAPTGATPITVIVTGTPLAPSAGASPRTLQVQLAVKAACKRVATVAELVAALAVPYPCIAVADDARISSGGTGPLVGWTRNDMR